MEGINNFNLKEIYKLNSSSVKGDNGIVLIIGGSEIYTGAPYFATISAYRSGCDLVYIFTPNGELKRLCPEAVVCLLTGKNVNNNRDDNENKNNDHVINYGTYNKHKDTDYDWILSRITVCIVGCGLGRVDFMLMKKIMEILLKIKVPVVFDGDGLNYFNYFMYCTDFCILTPNFNEFKKLKIMFSSISGDICFLDSKGSAGECKSNSIDEFRDIMCLKNKKALLKLNDLEMVNNIAELNNLITRQRQIKPETSDKTKVYIVKKGKIDLITDLSHCIAVDAEGSLKRCAGQGDILCGLISGLINKKIDIMVSLEVACRIMRRAASMAYRKFKRSLMASDILEFVRFAVNEFLE